MGECISKSRQICRFLNTCFRKCCGCGVVKRHQSISNTDNFYQPSPSTSLMYPVNYSGVQRLTSLAETICGLKKNGICEGAIFEAILYLLKAPLVIDIQTKQASNHERTFLFHYVHVAKEEVSDTVPRRRKKSRVEPTAQQTTANNRTIVRYGFQTLLFLMINDEDRIDEVFKILEKFAGELSSIKRPIDTKPWNEDIMKSLIISDIIGPDFCKTCKNRTFLDFLNETDNWYGKNQFHYTIEYDKQCYTRNRSIHQNLSGFDSIERIDCSFHQNNLENLDIRRLVTATENLHTKSTTLLRSSFTISKVKDLNNEYNNIMGQILTGKRSNAENLKDVSRKRSYSYDDDTYFRDGTLPIINEFTCTLINNYCTNIENLLQTIEFIEELNDFEIDYMHVNDIFPKSNASLEIENISAELKQQYIDFDESVAFFYSNTQLKQLETVWNRNFDNFKNELSSERIYLDFSDSACHLEKSEIMQFNMHDDKKILNMLLLGESGVGKSTFINAFVNYLAYNTFQEAEKNETIALIPSSFILTEGHDFEEVTINIGEPDSNEVYAQEGQSVTQTCHSYVFDLNRTTKLRIIDTPGLSDTRGVAKDEENLHHILTTINNLSHLNAVCILLKPIQSRLNIQFRTFFTTLFRSIQPIPFPNIMFCFTNSRSSFYSPGDTGPLLRSFLHQEDLSKIPFEKRNTFCFDSESFRYLAALRYGIKFEDDLREEYIQSWKKSVVSSNCLVELIPKCPIYSINRWRSTEKCLLDIELYARPVIETALLIIYNRQLSSLNQIQFRLKMIHESVNTRICTACAKQFNLKIDRVDMDINTYMPVKKPGNQKCECLINDNHYPIENIVQYEVICETSQSNQDDGKQLKTLKNFIDLYHSGPVSQSIKRMIARFTDDQRKLRDPDTTDHLSNKVYKEFISFLGSVMQLNSSNEHNIGSYRSTDEIQRCIAQLKLIPDVRLQVKKIKEIRLSRLQEKNINVNIINKQLSSTESEA